MDGLVEYALAFGARIAPLYADNQYYKGAGFMNPSILVHNGRILVNIRHINYTLYHAENTQHFPSHWGPLAYLHPEQDLTLRTINYMAELDSDLNMMWTTQVDTSRHDVEPLWEFHGLEDARLTHWLGKYYLIGVRRDTTPNGQGRMELSEIEIGNGTAIEVSRQRIPAPDGDSSYCEKNWMPIEDKPFKFVKWTAPTEVATYHPVSQQTTSVTTSTKAAVWDMRGGTQVVRWKGKYIAFVHETTLFANYLGQKDGIYRHRLAVWDEDFNLLGLSPDSFTFIGARIEFATGAAIFNDNLLVTFGYQDNAAFVVEFPTMIIDSLIGEATWTGR
jgi:hypothetical protein